MNPNLKCSCSATRRCSPCAADALLAVQLRRLEGMVMAMERLAAPVKSGDTARPAARRRDD